MPACQIRWIDPNPVLPESRTLVLGFNCTEGAVVTELHSVVDYHSGEFELRDGCELVGHLVEDGRVSDGSDPLFVPEPAGALIPALLILAVLAWRKT